MNDNRTVTCECGNPKMQIAAACTRCLELDRERYTRKTMRETLLNLIARHDGVTALDIRDALELGDAEARAMYRFLERFVEEGLVERHGKNTATMYWAVKQKRRAA